MCRWALGGLSTLQHCPRLPNCPSRMSLYHQAWKLGFQRITYFPPAAKCKLFCFPDIWGLLLLSFSTQQRLLWYWRDIPLLLLPRAEGDAPTLAGGGGRGSMAGQRPQGPSGPRELHPLCWGAWCPPIFPQREGRRAEAGRTPPLACPSLCVFV